MRTSPLIAVALELSALPAEREPIAALASVRLREEPRAACVKDQVFISANFNDTSRVFQSGPDLLGYGHGVDHVQIGPDSCLIPVDRGDYAERHILRHARVFDCVTQQAHGELLVLCVELASEARAYAAFKGRLGLHIHVREYSCIIVAVFNLPDFEPHAQMLRRATSAKDLTDGSVGLSRDGVDEAPTLDRSDFLLLADVEVVTFRIRRCVRERICLPILYGGKVEAERLSCVPVHGLFVQLLIVN